MSSPVLRRPVTLAESFSFYVPSTDINTLWVAGSLADAVTVKGPDGPAVIRSLRSQGWNVPVIFDRGEYNSSVVPIDPGRWFDQQASAGADRILSAGAWVDWSANTDNLKRAVEAEVALASRLRECTIVLAIDHRWLMKSPLMLAERLCDLGRPDGTDSCSSN